MQMIKKTLLLIVFSVFLIACENHGTEASYEYIEQTEYSSSITYIDDVNEYSSCDLTVSSSSTNFSSSSEEYYTYYFWTF